MGYDVFLSYARSDNDDGWVDGFRREICSLYRKLTGTELRMFFDAGEIATAAIWKERIRSALDTSDALIAILSPSYVRSEWCVKEWRAFEEREEALVAAGALGSDQGLILPVLLYPFDRGRFDESEADFVAGVRERQWMDVSSKLEGTPLRRDQLRGLVEDLIDNVDAVRANMRLAKSDQEYEVVPVIRDDEMGVEWFGSVSNHEMDIDEARAFVERLPAGSGNPWRLPTRAELESLLDPELLKEAATDPKASPFPLRQPFNSQRFGYLLSGEPVNAGQPDAPWIMNIRNGHIFNGRGNIGYVRAVRTIR